MTYAFCLHLCTLFWKTMMKRLMYFFFFWSSHSPHHEKHTANWKQNRTEISQGMKSECARRSDKRENRHLGWEGCCLFLLARPEVPMCTTVYSTCSWAPAAAAPHPHRVFSSPHSPGPPPGSPERVGGGGHVGKRLTQEGGACGTEQPLPLLPRTGHSPPLPWALLPLLPCLLHLEGSWPCPI